MIFDKYFQNVRLKLMKSFETTKKNCCGIFIFGDSTPNPKNRTKWPFCSIFGHIQAKRGGTKRHLSESGLNMVTFYVLGHM